VFYQGLGHGAIGTVMDACSGYTTDSTMRIAVTPASASASFKDLGMGRPAGVWTPVQGTVPPL